MHGSSKRKLFPSITRFDDKNIDNVFLNECMLLLSKRVTDCNVIHIFLNILI